MTDSDFWDRVKAGQPGAQPKTDAPPAIEDLLRSHHELRAILTLAGKRIKQNAMGRSDAQLLAKMRKVYTEARAIARKFEKGKE